MTLFEDCIVLRCDPVPLGIWFPTFRDGVEIEMWKRPNVLDIQNLKKRIPHSSLWKIKTLHGDIGFNLKFVSYWKSTCFPSLGSLSYSDQPYGNLPWLYAVAFCERNRNQHSSFGYADICFEKCVWTRSELSHGAKYWNALFNSNGGSSIKLQKKSRNFPTRISLR